MILIGVGHYAPDLEKVIQLIDKKGLKDNITLIPWLNREGVLSILNRSTCYISAARYEGLPYSVLEAMALSKPCILSDIDGHRELVTNDENGYLVGENATALAECIVKLFNDTNKQVSFGRNSKILIKEHHSIEKTIKRLEEIYINEVN